MPNARQYCIIMGLTGRFSHHVCSNMNQLRQNLLYIYQRLRAYFGPANWWPAETPLEVMVGAVLTQNSSWTNAEKAILALKRENLLTVAALQQVPLDHLARLVRSSGYYNQKAKKLKALINFIVDRYDSSVQLLATKPLPILREELLQIYGIGPETADSILLYALDKPIFVVDAYTRRIFSRHNFFLEGWNYQQIQDFFMAHLPRDIQLYNDFHALIVYTGKDFCRKKPSCGRCPLQEE